MTQSELKKTINRVHKNWRKAIQRNDRYTAQSCEVALRKLRAELELLKLCAELRDARRK